MEAASCAEESPSHDQGEEAQPGWQQQAEGEGVEARRCSPAGLMASTGSYSHAIYGRSEGNGSTAAGHGKPPPYARGGDTYSTGLGAIGGCAQA